MDEEYVLLDTRFISGVGVLRIPSDPIYRSFFIQSQVIRQPSNLYNNFEWSPPQSVYARIANMYFNFVNEYHLQRYEFEQWHIVPDICSQNLIAIKCMYDGILESFGALYTLLGEPDQIKQDFLIPMTPLPISTNNWVFNLYGDTAMKIDLFGLKHVKCGEQNPVEPPKPPKQPTFDPVPPRTPLSMISPPYDEDDTYTNPFEYDDAEMPVDPPEEFPVGDLCVKYRIDLKYIKKGVVNGTDFTVQFGEIADITLEASTLPGEEGFGNLRIFARGPANVGQTCSDVVYESFKYFGPLDDFTYTITELPN